MPGRMAGRVALITGGGGGIGEATGLLFAEEGARVALVDHDPAEVARAAAAIAARSGEDSVLALTADVAEAAQARRVVEATAAQLGGLHCLVNVAGIRVYQPLAEASEADWERILGVNLLGTAHCCKAAMPRLRAAGDATIVNVSSVYGVMGRSGMGQYDTTKAALLGYSRTLAHEEARHGVRVNTVCPGGTITPFHVRRAAAQGVDEDTLRRSRADANLLGRWAEPREVAYAILFLACAESSFVTGATLMIDGGRSIM
ncbi:MAG TPA: SDR family oxidoreductase [Burkholderiales bacterium]|nr:SDR family oxidoreductase [Burkholderiales bacterium]